MPTRRPLARARRAWPALITLAAVSACAHVRPADPVEEALYEDTRRIVQTASATGWIIDRIETERLAPAVMQSACQVSRAQRRELVAWLTGRVDEAGGPAAAQYLTNGRDKGALSGVIELERIRGLLRYADAKAEEDCPFWLEADPTFTGVQGDYDRFTLTLESRGVLAINIAGDDVGVGGGGGGRVLFGYGPSHDLTIMVGPELGAAALFQPDPVTGEREVSGTLVGGIPVVFRFNDGGRMYDIETGLTGIWREADERLDLGGRVALATGVATPRIGAFKPLVMFWLLYEYFPPQGGEPTNHFIGLGTRIGVNIDP